MRRFAGLLFTLVLMMAVAAGLAPAVSAAPATPQQTSGAPAHDMSHPERVNLPCFGQPRSGYGRQPVSDCGATKSGGNTGYANWPGGCYNNVGYLQTVHGATQWQATAYGVTVTVQYWWCPNYQGDTVGQNWSYGTAKPAGSSPVYFATGGSWGADLTGGYLGYNYGYYTDGESYTKWGPVYPGPTGYVWDYSTTGAGNGIYKWLAYMQVQVLDASGNALGSSWVNDGYYQ